MKPMRQLWHVTHLCPKHTIIRILFVNKLHMKIEMEKSVSVKECGVVSEELPVPMIVVCRCCVITFRLFHTQKQTVHHTAQCTSHFRSVVQLQPWAGSGDYERKWEREKERRWERNGRNEEGKSERVKWELVFYMKIYIQYPLTDTHIPLTDRISC